MNRFLAMTLALTTAAHAVAGTNLLVNGDFETPGDAPSHTDSLPGWTLVEPDLDMLGDPVNSATFWANAVANHTPSGKRGLWLQPFMGGFGDDAPPTVNATLYQDVVAHAGVRYTLTAWFKFDPNYTTNATNFSMQFLDTDMNVLSEVVADINDHNPRDSVWREFLLAAIADPGTAYLRAQVEMVDGMGAFANPQSGFVDDFTLVPTPGAAALFGLAAASAPVVRRRR